MRTYTLLPLTAALVLVACSPLTPVHHKTYQLTILHTNDHHGRFWQNSNGEYGMAARKTVIDQIRQEVAAQGGYTLLLDGGDVNTGVPESDMQDAVPDFKGMNLLGYDAMAVGNHEFDKPISVLEMQRKLANFPMLSANIYRGEQRMFAPYKMFNLDGLRVAVLGLTTEDTQRMVSPENVQGIEFRKPQAEAAALVPELRTKADVVIAATHMGHYENGNHGTQAEGDVELARAVKGLDMIVGGHTQNPACMKAENVLDRAYVPGTPCQPDRQNGTWIVQAHEWGKYVGRADFTYRDGVFTLVKYQLIPINLKRSVTGADGKPQLQTYTAPIAENTDMLALLKPYQEHGQALLSQPVGSADARIEGDRSVVRNQPAALGVLIARSMMEKTGADLAIVNSGGVRDSLPAGQLTYRHVLTVHPFGNTIGVARLSGQELLDYLHAAVRMSPGSGAFPQFAGVELVIEAGKVQSARIAGKALDLQASYQLAINNFMAQGGDGYPKLQQHPSYRDTGFVDADVLRAYIQKHSPLKAADYAPGNAVVRR
ncbi:bifunctional UDP-sugar hydrolase/5'-nucleotidase [Curvibacter sp. CHRR-16]|uniref:bifunctional UDP-sugar hydrolase/5'-nucleotidase UshA n=1 Tax=Curvibacter sp. CHRR-16 TaxID=2835872 RepID=UPI001BDB0F66|nr:bifunctional UDP-sugar hydrolase/5'-nucleotidase UshA [Curvibacter sp. CHRR-16]MBT0571602.1 bifunctional UDP-sugar hydrolase/5'-nucleotidase [Curvibacter sp. CHRR-16]